MKSSGVGAKFLLSVALAAVGMGIGAAFVAGFFLGHFTGHHHTTTVAAAEMKTVSPQVEEETQEATAIAESDEPSEPTAHEKPQVVFQQNCGACHTLDAAKTTGELGPNLDELEPTRAIVKKQVETGGGTMPAFGEEDLLGPEEIEEVSEYVASAAGA